MARATTFTSFINAAYDPGSDKAFDQLGAGFERAYARGTRAAQLAADQQSAIQKRIASATGLDRAFGNTGAAAASARAFIDLERRAEGLKSAIDPLYASQRRYDAELREARSLLEAGAISTAEFTARQMQLRNGLNATSIALGKGAVSAGAYRAAQANLGYQIADIAQSASLGINPLIILAQQGGQTAAALSGMGGIVGRVAGFLSGPWGAAVLGAVTAAGLLASKMGETGDESERSAKELAKAGIAADGLGNRTFSAAAAQRVLNEAQLSDRSGTLAGDVASLVAQRLKQANATFAAARSEAALRLAQGQSRLDDLADGRERTGRGQRELSTFATRGGSELQQERRKAKLEIEAARRDLDALEASYTRATKTIMSQAIANDSQLRDNRLQLATATSAYDRVAAKAASVTRTARLELDAGTISEKEYTRRVLEANAAVDAARAMAQGRTKAARQATTEARQQAREVQQFTKRQMTDTETLADIASRYDDAPGRVDKIEDDIRALNALIKKYQDLSDAQSVGNTKKARETLSAAEVSRSQPYADYVRQQEQGLAIQRLVLQGRTAEASALSTIYDLSARMVPLDSARRQRILDMAEANERAARAMEDQRRIVGLYTSAVGDAQRTFESFLSNLRTSPGKAFKNLGKELQDNLANLRIRITSEKLFGGLDREIENFVNGKTGVRAANEFLKDEITRAGKAMSEAADATANYARRVDQLAAGNSGAITTGTTPAWKDMGTAAGQIVAAQLDELNEPANWHLQDSARARSVAIPSAIASLRNINDRLAINLERTIGVKLPRSVQTAIAGGLSGYAQAGPIGAALEVAKGLKKFPDTLDGFLGKLAYNQKINGAIAGAQTGAMTAGVMKALGIKTSSTGAQLGGAIGSFIPIPGAEIIGSIAGGLIGGLLKKHKVGSANLTGPDESGVSYSGNSGSRKDTAKGLASNVLDNLNQIAEALGGTVGSFSTSIGVSGDSYHVDPTGQGKLRKSQGGLDFNDDAQAAIAAAVEDAVADGAITGISEASKRILQSGKDLQRAIEKATVIESIPKRLLQLTDPVRYAVTELNDEFSKMISYLQEGGASAQQFADAQKLYDLERAKAIEEATAQASSALQDFLNQMTGSNSSPLSKRDVYSNSRSEVEAFANQINAGKVVDENKFIDAAQRFDAASEALYGSSSQRFSDFDTIHDLVNRALANQSATGTTPTGQLPASPFTEDVMRQALQATSKEQVDATNNQTQVLNATLQDIRSALLNMPRQQLDTRGSSITLLPGFQR